MNGVFSDKEALSRKKFNYYQKSVFIIKTNKKTAVINYADKTKYTAFGEGDDVWEMDPILSQKLIRSINEFFDEKQAKIDSGKISPQFERRIIQPISDYNNLEYEVEKEAAFSSDRFNYSRFEIVSSTAKKKYIPLSLILMILNQNCFHLVVKFASRQIKE